MAARFRAAARTWLIIAGAFLFLLAFAMPAQAYIVFEEGLTSNLLVDQGRVIFTQADSSLTVLDLQTGRVLRRDKSVNDFGGRLYAVPEGVLYCAYSRGPIALLDRSTFAVIWQAKERDGVVLGDRVYAINEGALLVCREIATGKILATRENVVGLRLVNQRIFASRFFDPAATQPVVPGATAPSYDCAVDILDAELRPVGSMPSNLYDLSPDGRWGLVYTYRPNDTISMRRTSDGQELWNSPRGELNSIRFAGAFCVEVLQTSGGYPKHESVSITVRRIETGEVVLKQKLSPELAAGQFSRDVIVSGDPPRLLMATGPALRSPRPEGSPQWLVAVDAQGRRSEATPEDVQCFFERHDMTFGGREEGLSWYLKPRQFGFGRLMLEDVDRFSEVEPRVFKTTHYGLLEIMPKDGPRWRMLLTSVLRHYGDRIETAGDLLLIGSNTGHVECIDLKARASRWLYRFPSIIGRPNGPRSDGFRVPHVSTLYIQFQRRNNDLDSMRPAVLLPDDFDPYTATSEAILEMARRPTQAAVIRDPMPIDLFAGYGKWFALAVTGAVLPLGLWVATLVLVWRRPRPLPPWAMFACVAWTALAYLVHRETNQMDFIATLVMKFTALFALDTAAVMAATHLGRRKHVVAAVVCLALMVVFAYVAHHQWDLGVGVGWPMY